MKPVRIDVLTPKSDLGIGVRRSAVVLLTVVLALVSGLPDASAGQIFGTNEDDELTATSAGDLIFGRGGRDKMVTSSEGGSANGGPGADRSVGSPAGDALIDDDGTGGDILQSGGGVDFLISADGAKGDKVRCGGSRKDIAIVDRGDDVSGCETVRWKKTGSIGTFRIEMGTNDADVITVTTPNTVIFGKRGSDTITVGGGSSASIFLGSGADQATGWTSDDSIFDDDGEAGDSIDGGAGWDTLFSADGAADTIDCGEPTDPGDVYADEVGVDTLVDCDGSTVHRAT